MDKINLLPRHLSENKDMPDEAKVMLNSLLMHCFWIKSNHLTLDGDFFKIKFTNLKTRYEELIGRHWLEIYGLIDVKASSDSFECTVNFDKLIKPLKQKTFEELFSDRLIEVKELAELQKNIHKMIITGV